MSEYAREAPDVDIEDVPEVADDSSPERHRVPDPEERDG